VGKTYMACAGIKACDYQVPEHTLVVEKTRRVINMAFDMMKEVENVTYNSGQDKIKIKIGIHSGRVIAGVIGLHKPQFSLIGDTVNTTSRICSTGDSGVITISEEAYEKVKGSELQFIKKSVEVRKFIFKVRHRFQKIISPLLLG
jgi:class 3 adenylate cyclase